MTDFHFLPDTAPMPVIFAGHGNPMNAIEQNEFTQTWNTIGKEIPAPALIVSISAHWETRGTKITAMPAPQTIHDFGGFPDALYNVQYPAPGNPDFAGKLIDSLGENTLSATTDWGLDHGTWSVLKHIFPKADIPVLQISLNRYFTPEQHYSFARELAILRNKGVLLFSSGNIVHNLREVDWYRTDYGHEWAMEARDKVNDLLLSDSYDKLVQFKNLGPAMAKAAPTDEHFLPLLYSMALKNDNDQVSLFNDKLVMGSLSMTGVMISNGK